VNGGSSNTGFQGSDVSMETSSTSILEQVRRLLFQDLLWIGVIARHAQHTIRAKRSIVRTAEPSSSASLITRTSLVARMFLEYNPSFRVVSNEPDTSLSLVC
jgi:hypothetical protein